MAVVAVTPRYPMGVSRSNSQLRRIRDIARILNAPSWRASSAG
jgi:hypothetical protein